MWQFLFTVLASENAYFSMFFYYFNFPQGYKIKLWLGIVKN